MTTAAAEPVTGLAAAALDLMPQSLYIVDRNLTVVAWNAQREQGQQVEVYLATRADATFTHGICDDCAGRAHLAGQDLVCVPRPSARPGRPTAP